MCYPYLKAHFSSTKNLRTQRNCNKVNVSIDKEAFLNNIALASDKTLTPSRTAAQIVGATLSTASDSAEVNRLTLSHSSLHRRRDKLRLSSDKIITENWKRIMKTLYFYCIGMKNH